jgi:hypothetical protein
MGTVVFNLIGRYFWLVCLVLSLYQYFVGLRSFASKDFTDPQAGEAAIALRRWLFVLSDLPWLVMGFGILVGGVPNVWYFLRPHDGNPYVLAWFGSVLACTLYFTLWVFFLGGAEKVVVLKPFEVKWHRTGFRGTTSGTVQLTVGRVKLFAAFAPIWIGFCTYLMYVMDAPLPK